jgi:hypothetical protein
VPDEKNGKKKKLKRKGTKDGEKEQSGGCCKS